MGHELGSERGQQASDNRERPPKEAHAERDDQCGQHTPKER